MVYYYWVGALLLYNWQQGRFDDTRNLTICEYCWITSGYWWCHSAQEFFSSIIISCNHFHICGLFWPKYHYMEYNYNLEYKIFTFHLEGRHLPMYSFLGPILFPIIPQIQEQCPQISFVLLPPRPGMWTIDSRWYNVSSKENVFSV